MVLVPEIDIDLDELNHSELVLLAEWCGLPASRGVPRRILIKALNEFEPIEIQNPIDKNRLAVSRWLERLWDRVQMQVGKKVCPNCYACRDIQVLECHALNRKQIGG